MTLEQQFVDYWNKDMEIQIPIEDVLHGYQGEFIDWLKDKVEILERENEELKTLIREMTREPVSGKCKHFVQIDNEKNITIPP